MARKHHQFIKPMTAILLAALAFSLGACTSVKKDGTVNSRMDPDRVEIQMDDDDLKKAAQSPLYDLNLKRDKIPALLSNIDRIYEEPGSCVRAGDEVANLSGVLGPDPAELEETKNAKITVKPADALGSAISSTIPYNNIIRMVSGANAYEKKYAAAYFRGHLRRSFINGWLKENNCPPVPTPKIKPLR